MAADTSTPATPSQPANRRAIGLTVAAVSLACAAVVAGLSYWNHHHYQQALEAFERRDFGQAESHLQQRVTLGLGSLEGELLGVRTARRSRNLEEAAKRLRYCQKRFGSEPTIALEEQLYAVQQGDLRQAAELLESHASDQEPEAPWVLEAYIVGSLQQLMAAYTRNETYEGGVYASELARTRRAVDQWLTLRPGKPDQVQGLVWSYQANLFSHFLDKARNDIERALQLDPDHREARTMLAIHLGQEHPAEAAAQWQTLHDQFPDDIDVAMNLADLRRRLGQLEEAQALLDQILTDDPHNGIALIHRGRVALDLDDLPGAEEWFRSACREEPDSIEANLSLSRCLMAAGKMEEAGRLQKKAEQLREDRIRQREAALSSTLP